MIYFFVGAIHKTFLVITLLGSEEQVCKDQKWFKENNQNHLILFFKISHKVDIL